jgi:methylmalonyl-CoA mutase N-terminal domain/subunit
LKVLQQHAHFEAIHEYDPSFVDKQIKRLNKVKQERDPEKLKQAAAALIEAMKSKQNMMPTLIDAVKSGITRGEFAKIKADVFQQPGGGPYVCSPPHVLA